MTEWRECEKVPVKAEENRKQIKYGGYLYNHHQTTTQQRVYRCKYYSRHACQSKLKQVISNEKYYVKGCHSHPTTCNTSRNISSLSDLSTERQEALKNYIMQNPRIRSSKDVCAVLNTNGPKDDVTWNIFPSQVVQAKEKYLYMASITDWQDLFIRDELSKTKHGQQFTRTVHLYPEFLIQWSADWQIQQLNGI